jgi:hypothetical protein
MPFVWKTVNHEDMNCQKNVWKKRQINFVHNKPASVIDQTPFQITRGAKQKSQ